MSREKEFPTNQKPHFMSGPITSSVSAKCMTVDNQGMKLFLLCLVVAVVFATKRSSPDWDRDEEGPSKIPRREGDSSDSSANSSGSSSTLSLTPVEMDLNYIYNPISNVVPFPYLTASTPRIDNLRGKLSHIIADFPTLVKGSTSTHEKFLKIQEHTKKVLIELKNLSRASDNGTYGVDFRIVVQAFVIHLMISHPKLYSDIHFQLPETLRLDIVENIKDHVSKFISKGPLECLARNITSVVSRFLPLLAPLYREISVEGLNAYGSRHWGEIILKFSKYHEELIGMTVYDIQHIVIQFNAGNKLASKEKIFETLVSWIDSNEKSQLLCSLSNVIFVIKHGNPTHLSKILELLKGLVTKHPKYLTPVELLYILAEIKATKLVTISDKNFPEVKILENENSAIEFIKDTDVFSDSNFHRLVGFMPDSWISKISKEIEMKFRSIGHLVPDALNSPKYSKLIARFHELSPDDGFWRNQVKKNYVELTADSLISYAKIFRNKTVKPLDQYDDDFDLVMDALNDFHFCASNAIPIQGSGDDTLLSAFERLLTIRGVPILETMEIRGKFSQALEKFMLGGTTDPNSWIAIAMEKVRKNPQ